MKVYTFEEFCKAIDEVIKNYKNYDDVKKEIIQRAPVLENLLKAEFVYLQRGERRNFVILDSEFLVVGLHRVRLTNNYSIKLGCDGQGRCFLCELTKRYAGDISKSRHYIVFNVFDLVEKKVKLLLLFCEGINLKNENFSILMNLSKEGKLQGTEIIVKLASETDKFQGYYVDGVVIAKRYKIGETLERKKYDVRELFELKDFTFLENFGYEIGWVKEKLNKYLIELNEEEEEMLLVEKLDIEEEEVELDGEVKNEIINEIKNEASKDLKVEKEVFCESVGENVIELNKRKEFIDLTKECLEKADKSYMEQKLKEIEEEEKLPREIQEIINTHW